MISMENKKNKIKRVKGEFLIKSELLFSFEALPESIPVNLSTKSLASLSVHPSSSRYNLVAFNLLVFAKFFITEISLEENFRFSFSFMGKPQSGQL